MIRLLLKIFPFIFSKVIKVTLPKHHTWRQIRGSAGKLLYINFSTWWRWTVSFIPQKKVTWHLLHGILRGPQWQRKKSLPLASHFTKWIILAHIKITVFMWNHLYWLHQFISVLMFKPNKGNSLFEKIRSLLLYHTRENTHAGTKILCFVHQQLQPLSSHSHIICKLQNS